MPAVQQKIRSGLVELRTNVGLLYVSPSFWERIYLLWTFRNFHRLPEQVLNRHQKQLIEKLCRTAIVARKGPIARSSLIGAVENVHVASECETEAATSTGKLVRMSAPDVGFVASRAVGSEGTSSGRNRPASIRTAIRPFPGRNGKVEYISSSKPDSAMQTETKRPNEFAVASGVRKIWDRNWLGGALVATCAVVLLGMLFYFREGRLAPSNIVPQVGIEAHTSSSGSLPSSGIAKPQKISQSMRAEQAKGVTTIALQTTSPAGSSRQDESDQSKKIVVSNAPAATMDSTSLGRLQVAESPKSGFSYPIAPNAALTGKATLKAVIGTDGTVKSVDVLSGNRALASAAVQAVRHWRYASHELNGNAVEAETNIVISFLGDEAVSITFQAAK